MPVDDCVAYGAFCATCHVVAYDVGGDIARGGVGIPDHVHVSEVSHVLKAITGQSHKNRSTCKKVVRLAGKLYGISAPLVILI